MQNFLPSVVLSILLLSSCEKLGINHRVEKVKEDSQLSYPINRLIRDPSGREIQVIILGKTTGQIIFERLPDGKRFELPLNRLSEADQLFVNSLPIKAAPAEKADDPSPNQIPRYLEVRLGDIEGIELEIAQQKAELKTAQWGPIEANEHRRRIKDLENEAEDLKRDVETYKKNNNL